MVKEYLYRGKTQKELEAMGLNELAKLFKASARRKLKRGLTEDHKKLLEKIRKYKSGKSKKPVRTHQRDMVILPEMIGTKISVHSGKEFFPIDITTEMIGHLLGEFVMTRKEVTHSAAGIGATRSSKHVSVK